MSNGKLTAAMTRALDKFGQEGGHGFGAHSGITKTVAEALEKRGLIRISIRNTLSRAGTSRALWVGEITEAGRAALSAHAIRLYGKNAAMLLHHRQE